MADTATASGNVIYEPAPTEDQVVARRSLLRQAVRDTFGQFGARMGSLWICVLVFCGIAAPFLASTHPILMKVDGKWSSPMWDYVTPVDLILVAAALVMLFMWLIKRATFGETLVTIVVAIAIVSPAAIAFKKPPAGGVNYQAYRDLENSGRTQFMLRTLIPYSPTDRLRDMPERRLTWPLASLSNGVVTKTSGEKFDGIIETRPELLSIKTRQREVTVQKKDVQSVQYNPGSLLRTNWLGTETDGADLLSRMIHASRIALSIGLISTSISVTLGILVGGIMGYYVGRVDLFGMRIIEVFEATPQLLVLITVMAAYGRSIYLMMVVIGLLGWTGTARFIRAEFLKLRQQDFVHAAIAVGLPKWTVIYKHILPNALTPVLVTATFGIASAILTESILSFLGLGLIDEPSWGQMLNQARSGGQGFVWWMAIFPGAAIFLTVYSYALIGDAMRDALDPKLRKRE